LYCSAPCSLYRSQSIKGIKELILDSMFIHVLMFVACNDFFKHDLLFCMVC
jgi:hypothetical protein